MIDQEKAPIWITVKDAEDYFSIKKTMCYELINEGKIESRLLKKSGGISGKRLISYESASNFINALPTGKDDSFSQN